MRVHISAQTTLCSGDVGLEQLPVPMGGHSCSSETRVPATWHSTLSPPPCCGTHSSHQANPRGMRPHAPDLHTSSERGHRNQNTGACCSLLHLFYSRMPREMRSIPLPRVEDLNSPAPPWGAQCPPGALCCAQASLFAHTHAHTHAPIPGICNDTQTCQAPLAGEWGQTGLWLTPGALVLGQGQGGEPPALPKGHRDSPGAARQAGSPAGLTEPP